MLPILQVAVPNAKIPQVDYASNLIRQLLHLKTIQVDDSEESGALQEVESM
jgi:hypothetical protein